MPTVPDVLARLEKLGRSQYSKASREEASAWATPLLIDNETTTISTEPPALGEALFLLGAADLLAQPPDTYLYQEGDFIKARRDLAAAADGTM